tara:strand:+ start:57 stop:323 length:267 start_codon:yes stop_codon:yes gene_type:complete
MKAAKILLKTILVTGCSSGIGKELAIYLRRAGKYQQKVEFTLGPERVTEKINCTIISDNPRTRYFASVQAYTGTVMSRLFPALITPGS